MEYKIKSWLLYLLVFILLGISAIKGGPLCDRFILASIRGGVIASENFPFKYHNYLDCKSDIYVGHLGQDARTICFRFKRFDIENTANCTADYLTIAGIKYCGKQAIIPNEFKQTSIYNLTSAWSESLCYVIQGDTIPLLFHSDDQITKLGYYATYYFPDQTRLASSMPPYCQSSQCPPSGILRYEYNKMICVCGQTHSESAPCKDHQFTCFNRKCIEQHEVCNWVHDCQDGSDEEYAHTSTHTQCSLYPIINGQADTSACDFSNGYCHIFESRGFERGSDRIGVYYSPHSDHTGSLFSRIKSGYIGFYVWAIMSNTTSKLKTNRRIRLSYGNYCLSFWYFMYSPDLWDELAVVARLASWSRPELIWKRSGNFGQSWKHGQVLIVPVGQGTVEIDFIAKYMPDHDTIVRTIALDDISLLEGDCTEVDITCMFNHSMCGWTQTPPTAFSYDVSALSTMEFKMFRRPPGFVEIYRKYAVDTTSVGLLVSQAITSVYTYMCFSFYYDYTQYHLYGGKPYIKVMSMPPGKTLGQSHHINLTSSLWVQEQVEFKPVKKPYVVIIQAIIPPQTIASIAVDDIRMDIGPCLMPKKPVPSTPIVTTSVSTTPWYRCKSSWSYWACCLDGSFVQRYKLCDGIIDCRDKSDERNCSVTTISSPICSQTKKISANQQRFHCRNGCIIILAAKCDGHNDCSDGSDEDHGFARCLKKPVKLPESHSSLSMSSTTIASTAVLSSAAIIFLAVGIALFQRKRRRQRLLAESMHRRDMSINNMAFVSDSTNPGGNDLLHGGDPPLYSDCVGDTAGSIYMVPSPESPPAYNMLFKNGPPESLNYTVPNPPPYTNDTQSLAIQPGASDVVNEQEPSRETGSSGNNVGSSQSSDLVTRNYTGPESNTPISSRTQMEHRDHGACSLTLPERSLIEQIDEGRRTTATDPSNCVDGGNVCGGYIPRDLVPLPERHLGRVGHSHFGYNFESEI